MARAMPIYEYVCRACDRRFEAIVTAARQANCRGCASNDLEKQLSVFAVTGTTNRESGPIAAPCGSCGDPRGPGACSLN